MGGTTFKVGTVREGLIEYQRESMVLRYHYALPKMDVVSLGLAGGSIISVDARTGTPRIGPKSAGSYPGPVCYAHGGEEPTITDIDAILGYLNPAYFLGGRAELDIAKARRVFEEKVAGPLGLELIPAAAAMYKLANSLFYDLLHKTTVQRGLDPRRFALFSFGGTAGMHVGAYGEHLGVSQIVIPYSASVHGAFGLVTSDIAHEDQITQPLRAPFDVEAIAGIYAQLEERIVAQLEAEGFDRSEMRLNRAVDMRYRRQVHILTSPFVGDEVTADSLEQTVDMFERLYEEKYGPQSAYREAGIELVSFRVRGIGVVSKHEFQRRRARRHGSLRGARRAGPGVGGQGGRAPGGAGLRLRAPAPWERDTWPGHRLDADHDTGRLARPDRAPRRASQPRSHGGRLRTVVRRTRSRRFTHPHA